MEKQEAHLPPSTIRSLTCSSFLPTSQKGTGGCHEFLSERPCEQRLRNDKQQLSARNCKQVLIDGQKHEPGSGEIKLGGRWGHHIRT